MCKANVGNKLSLKNDLARLAKLTLEIRKEGPEISIKLQEETIDLLIKTKPFRELEKVLRIRSEAVRALSVAKKWDTEILKLTVVVSNP
ncbi:hypothetical protein A9R01_07725 ['Osedax' symbiont bacterium Rs2_46_30_T18]|nr:hypothetical protein A9R01_07725 ['Osedax' symbiont bacterium Rs2_46_30_T18]